MGAIINRELKNRIRTINGIGQHKIIVRNDLRLITKIIKKLDERWNIWESINNDNEEKKVAITVPSSTDDSEISSSTTTNTLIIKNKNPIGFISYNPLLKNITEYLVDEGDAEEEEELNTFEMDKELTKVIKKKMIFIF
jgi:hypothetical protein